MITPNLNEKLPAAFVGKLLVKEWEGEAIPHATSSSWLLEMTRRDGDFVLTGCCGRTLWHFLRCHEDEPDLAYGAWYRLTGTVLSHHELYGSWEQRA